MSDLALDDDGDLELTLGKARVVTGVEALSQRLSIRVKLFRGDWFLNVLEGVPYHDFVLRKRTSQAVRREVFRKTIATTPSVQQIVSLNVDLDQVRRSLSVSGEVVSTDPSIVVPFVASPPLLGFPVLPAEGAAA